jgi:adenylate kinase family enzyme
MVRSLTDVDRVVILGHGGAGKSTLAVHLSLVIGLSVIELDKHYWNEDLTPMPVESWVRMQEQLAAADRWIMDGDLGPYDVPAPRLRRADTVVVLDLSPVRCAWRAARRSRERADFWWWLLTWRWRSRSRVARTARAPACWWSPRGRP